MVTLWGGLGAVVPALKRARGVRSAPGASRGARRAELAAVPLRVKRGTIKCCGCPRLKPTWFVFAGKAASFWVSQFSASSVWVGLKG